MSRFVVIPKYRGENLIRYDAPAFFIEANDGKNAEIVAREKSGLSRFPEWFFYITGDEYVFKNYNVVAKQRERNPKSKRQLGKIKTGHSESRCNRRAKKRGNVGAMKRW